MKVALIAQTYFRSPPEVFIPEDSAGSGGCGGQDLAEFAGRACYQSFAKPNPKTATNEGYLAHILEVGHLSVLEHGSATFYITGVSRSLTHELVRHRHLSYSQLSQRYVDESAAEFVTPPLVKKDAWLRTGFDGFMARAQDSYNAMVEELASTFPEAKRKEIRQAARSVLPNATSTKIVVTGNYRAWREVIKLRGTEAADVEIRALAVELLRHLKDIAPNVFQDMTISSLPDGTEVVT